VLRGCGFSSSMPKHSSLPGLKSQLEGMGPECWRTAKDGRERGRRPPAAGVRIHPDGDGAVGIRRSTLRGRSRRTSPFHHTPSWLLPVRAHPPGEGGGSRRYLTYVDGDVSHRDHRRRAGTLRRVPSGRKEGATRARWLARTKAVRPSEEGADHAASSLRAPRPSGTSSTAAETRVEPFTKLHRR